MRGRKLSGSKKRRMQASIKYFRSEKEASKEGRRRKRGRKDGE